MLAPNGSSSNAPVRRREEQKGEIGRQSTEDRGGRRRTLHGEEGEAEEFGRVAQALVRDDQFGLAISARAGQVEGVEGADRHRRGMAIARGHDGVELGLYPHVYLEHTDLAGGNVLAELRQHAFCRPDLDKTSALFAEGDAAHFIEGEPGGDYERVIRRLLDEVRRVRLREVELAQSGGVPVAHALSRRGPRREFAPR